MRRILVTGKNSYVGTSIQLWLEKHPDKYSVESISLRNDDWRDKDFSDFDVILHAAGIAHIKETKNNAHLYYKVNRDLAYEVAQKAKIEGVKQFIFLSSMSVYGIETGVINKDSSLKPKSSYGKSKYEAEKLIANLENSFFKVAILRPPMIYGRGCKGNYSKLANFLLKTPVFPDIYNKRSMIYIDNLCELVRLIIDNSNHGIFHPQNKEYVCTSEMVKLIADINGKKIKPTKLFNPFIKLLKTRTLRKLFGDLVYEQSMSDLKMEYQICDFKSSISMTEKRNNRDINMSTIYKKEPLISIVMPAYNSEKFIREAITSVIEQTYKSWELIVIDDGSNDGTVSIIKELSEKDGRIQLYINEDNKGVSATRNRGISLANGDWIAFLDSDDIWDGNKLQKQMEYANKLDAEFLFTGASYINESGDYYPGIFEVPNKVSYEELRLQNVISCSSVVIKKKFFDSIKMERDDMHEDYAVWLRVLKAGVYAHGINEPLLIYRISRSSKSGNKIKTIMMTYKVFRFIGVNPIGSSYFMTRHIIGSVKKYKKIKSY